jgi:hypothetical protein
METAAAARGRVAGGVAFRFLRFNNRNNGPTPPLFLVDSSIFFRGIWLEGRCDWLGTAGTRDSDCPA